MSNDPWFIDLHGSVKPEAEALSRDRFYEKIIAIGQRIQSSLQAAANLQAAATPAPPDLPQVAPSTQTTSSIVPVSSIATTQSAIDRVRRENYGTTNEISAKRRKIESTLRNGAVQQWHWKVNKKQPEDIQGPGPELDIEDILIRAQLLVPPVSGLFAQKSPASESFDENDYYSSQANSMISSPQQHSNDALEASAAAASDGEIVEEEFEPALISIPPPNLLPAFQEAEDAAYEPVLTDAHQEEDDYEPPAIESPPYEPVVVPRPTQQLMNALAGPPLAPAAISINHIQSPIAPQPSHISPLTTATFAQQLDVSAEQSSKSDHDIVPVSKKKGKGKKKKGLSPQQQTTNKQKNAAKKRKREEEAAARVSNKRRSQGDAAPFIKQEPMSPPPLTQNGQSMNGGDTSDVVSQAQTSFQVPAGFRLVPIEQNGSSNGHPQSYETPLVRPKQFAQPLLRDDRGNEYYAYVETQPPYRPDVEFAGVDQRGRMPPEVFQRYQSPGPQSTIHNLYADSQARGIPIAYQQPMYREPSSRERYSVDARFAPHPQSSIGLYPGAHESGRHGQESLSMGGARGSFGHPSVHQSHGGLHMPESGFHGGHQQVPQAVYNAFEPARAHSVYPQINMAPHRQTSVTAQHVPLPVPLHARANSVYPSIQIHPQVPPYPPRYEEGFVGGHAPESSRLIGRY